MPNKFCREELRLLLKKLILKVVNDKQPYFTLGTYGFCVILKCIFDLFFVAFFLSALTFFNMKIAYGEIINGLAGCIANAVVFVWVFYCDDTFLDSV